jgi:hypothetical protein
MLKQNELLTIVIAEFLLFCCPYAFAPKTCLGARPFSALVVDVQNDDSLDFSPLLKIPRFTLPKNKVVCQAMQEDDPCLTPSARPSSWAAMEVSWAFQGSWELFEQRRIRSCAAEGLPDDYVLKAMLSFLYGNEGEPSGQVAFRRDYFAFWIQEFVAECFKVVSWGDSFLGHREHLCVFKELVESDKFARMNVGKQRAALQMVNVMLSSLEACGVWDKSAATFNYQKAIALFDWCWDMRPYSKVYHRAVNTMLEHVGLENLRYCDDNSVAFQFFSENPDKQKIITILQWCLHSFNFTEACCWASSRYDVDLIMQLLVQDVYLSIQGLVSDVVVVMNSNMPDSVVKEHLVTLFSGWSRFADQAYLEATHKLKQSFCNALAQFCECLNAKL